jgi:hypothetical protein
MVDNFGTSPVIVLLNCQNIKAESRRHKIVLTMNKEETYDYIFGNHTGEYVVNRLGWLDALLSDIRTIIDGYQCLRENSKGSEAYGAGNISIHKH